MLSRISSFSGPLAKLFRKQDIAPYISSNGLILRWEIGDGSSFLGYGTTIEDMTENNLDGVIVGTIAYGGGYLSIQGSSTEYVRTPSLNAYLVPANTGSATSIFLWIYPTSAGIIVSEEGTTTGDAGGWYDAQIQMNSAGNLLFSMWPYSTGSPVITSGSTYALNEWYYVGYSYDGANFKAYVNGSLVGSVSPFGRQTPYNHGGSKGMHYYIGYPTSTNMVTNPGGLGAGPKASFRLGAVHIYNRGITAQEAAANYNAQKDGYVEVPTTGLQLLLDDSSYPGYGTSWLDISGNARDATMASSPTFVSTGGGYFSLNGTSQYFTLPSGFSDFTSGITILAFADFGAANSYERIIDIGNGPSSDNILLCRKDASNTLTFHMYNGASLGVGVDFSNGVLDSQWGFYGARLDGSTYKVFNQYSSATGSTTALPTNTSRSNNYIGESNWAADSFFDRYIGVVAIYNRALTDAEIDQFYDFYKDRYLGYVRDNLVLHFDPSKGLSYPGSGSTLYDLTTNGIDGTMSGVAYASNYLEFNGSNSQISLGDSASVEPTTGDWTMEFWANFDSFSATGHNFAISTLWNGQSWINSNQVQLSQTAQTELISAGYVMVGSNGATRTVESAYSDGTYTYIGLGSMATYFEFPITFTSPDYSAGSSQVMIGKFDPGGGGNDVSYSLRAMGNGTIYAQYGNGTTYADSVKTYVPTPGQWLQITVVFTNVAANTIDFYVNGANQGQTSHSFASLLNTTAGLYIGSYNGGEYAQYFNGKMGVCRIYSSALTANEVLRNFEADRSTYGI